MLDLCRGIREDMIFTYHRKYAGRLVCVVIGERARVFAYLLFAYKVMGRANLGLVFVLQEEMAFTYQRKGIQEVVNGVVCECVVTASTFDTKLTPLPTCILPVTGARRFPPQFRPRTKLWGRKRVA